MAEIYDTAELLSVMRVQRAPSLFYLEQFTNQINFDTDKIYFDRVYGDDRRLAPFVVPNVQGRVLGMDQYDGVSFRPAYVKPKHVVDPNMVIKRQPGELLGTGSLTNDQRRNAVIAEILRRHKVSIVNSWNWLASQAAVTGKVVIKGEDYPETLVDFKRDASLTGTLVGNARWSDASAKPLDDIKAMRIKSNVLSGTRNRRVVFGQNAWDAFTRRVDLREYMNRNYGGSNTQVTLMIDGYEGVEYAGVIEGLNGAGRIEAWIDTSKYVDIDGTEKYFLDQDSVAGLNPEGMEGIRCFGAIKDKGADYKSLEIFTKNWENQDPSVEYLLSQSAPLMVPKQPNATFSIKVL